jgi:serine/threonine-protein kinase
MTTSGSLRDLFETALTLPVEQRAAFLDANCHEPADRARLQRMLDADARTVEPVSHTSIDRLAYAVGDFVAPTALPAGSRIGPFEVVGMLGEGGSSTVFHATRTNEGVTQHVALKLMRQSLHSPEARRRFNHEQRALLQLRHPNIARMLEGGVTETGLPYIVLELVDGASITEHARERRLDLRARLRLFVVACRAVDAAHRALIVHRDLKPSNVLVALDGEVKLLDFGIAKLLVDENDGTHTLLPAFTPAYAAPEQREGAAVTTATDVYALGVLLGELVTGQRLNDGSGRTPSRQISETAEPGVLPAPAAVTRRQLRGDLDAIVLKAIDADPARRYASAGHLADDIERLLAGRTVVARTPSRWYRARKFVLRNKAGVASTIAFLLAILAALGMALWQARVARHEASRAVEQTHRAEAVRDFLVSVFEAAGADLPRDKRPTVEELVDDASEHLQRDVSMAEETRVDLLMTLAKVSGNIGIPDQAYALLDRAAPVVDRLYPPSSAPWLQVRVLRADLLEAQGRPGEARALLEPLRASMAARRDEIGVRGLIVLAKALYAENRHDDAHAVYTQARAIVAALPVATDALAMALDVAQAGSFVQAHQFPEGLALADATWKRWKATGREPDRGVLDLLASISTAADMTGDEARAETAYRDAIDVAERLYVRPHPDTAWVIGAYGSYLVSKGRYDQAEPYIERALTMRRSVLGDAHPDTLNAIAAMGRLRAGQMKPAEAIRWFTEGVDLCARERVKHNVCPRLLGSLSQVLSTEDPDKALEYAMKAVEAQRELTGPDAPQLMGVLGFLARAQVKRERYLEAVSTTDELLRIAEHAGNATSKEVRYARFQRALSLFELDRNAEALELSAAVATEQKVVTPDEKTTLFSMLTLQARALSRAKRYDEAKAIAAEALAIERKPQPLAAEIVPGLKRLAETGRGY